MTTSTRIGQPLPFRILLDEAVKLSRRHFRRIFPAVALPVALVAAGLPLAQGLMFRGMTEGQAPNTLEFVRGMAGFVFAMFAFFAIYTVGYAALFGGAVDATADREVSMGRSWRFMLRPRVLGTMLLTGAAVLLGFLFCILPGIYLGLLFSFVVPVMVDEGLFGTAALRRSAQLARYNPQGAIEADPRLKVFVILFVGTLLSYVANLLVQMPLIVMQQVMMFREVAGGERADPMELMTRMTWIQVPSQVISMLIGTAVNLYVCFGLALFFFDLKRRREGLDLEAAVADLMRSRGVVASEPQAP